MKIPGFKLRCIVAIWLLPLCVLPRVFAQTTVCARVEIQIEQELTFEREGFEARLGVTNGTPADLTNFTVTLRFSDVNGNPVVTYSTGQVDSPPVGARFFHREQPGLGVPANATIAAGASANIAYLLVPSPGAARDDDGNELVAGRLYFVGATVTYTSGGRNEVVEVMPDTITVRPMPDLELQYFLPGAVHGDDPLTTGTVEPVIPFPLGVRVLNHSTAATARKLKIQSGQPKIIANEQGLLVQFAIISSEVNDQPAQPTLLADLGDIAPQRASVAAWMMTSSLSGSFVNFTGEVAHAPEFGGALTSLIPPEAISTRRLLGRVRVDLPGRDHIHDFLATASMTGDIAAVTLHESDTDTPSVAVPLNSTATTTPLNGNQSTLIMGAATPPMLYVRVPSPIAADKLVVAVRASDGKTLPAANAWISKSRDNDLNDNYTLSLFDTFVSDVPSLGYTLTFVDAPQANRAPELTLTPAGPLIVPPDHPLAITATGSDPDGTIPSLTTGLLPDGASFPASALGGGALTWTPTAGQIGDYVIQFRVTDAAGANASKAIRVIVDPDAVPISGYANWAETHWPGVTDPAIIGSHTDPDGDGFDNLMEYALDGDPNMPDDSILPTIGRVQIEGMSYLALTYRHRTDDDTLALAVVSSTNAFAPIASWTEQTTEVSVGAPDPMTGLREVTIRDSVPVQSGGPQRYLRLRVTRQTP